MATQTGLPGEAGRVEVGDIQIAFEDSLEGAASGRPPILLLHGAVQTRSIWRAQVEALRPARRVVVPDLRGHGGTSFGTRRLTVEQLAEDALALLDALAIDRATVCGVSLGGMVALEMASRAPHRIGALALANTPTSLTSLGWLRRLIDRVDPQNLLPLAIRLLGGAKSARIGLALASRLVGPHWVGRTARRHFIRGFATMSPEAIRATYRAIVEARPADIRHVACPTLLIAGRRDAPSILSQTEGLADTLLDVRIEWIRAGHVAPLDDPSAFNRRLLGFLETHGA